MWFFMISCYVLSLTTFVMLMVFFFQIFFQFHVLNASPFIFMLLTSIVYCFTETLIIFFFVGTGVSIKEYSQEKQLEPGFYKDALTIKRVMFPQLTMNILFMMTLFILYGAVDTGKMSAGLYCVFFVLGLAHYLYDKLLQHRAFRDNTNNILAMVGVTRSS